MYFTEVHLIKKMECKPLIEGCRNRSTGCIVSKLTDLAKRMVEKVKSIILFLLVLDIDNYE